MPKGIRSGKTDKSDRQRSAGSKNERLFSDDDMMRKSGREQDLRQGQSVSKESLKTRE